MSTQTTKMFSNTRRPPKNPAPLQHHQRKAGRPGAPSTKGDATATAPLDSAVPLPIANQKTIRGELESKKATEEHEYFRFHSVNTNVGKHVPNGFGCCESKIEGNFSLPAASVRTVDHSCLPFSGKSTRIILLKIVPKPV